MGSNHEKLDRIDSQWRQARDDFISLRSPTNAESLHLATMRSCAMRPQSPAHASPLPLPFPGEYSCLFTEDGSDVRYNKQKFSLPSMPDGPVAVGTNTQYVLTVHDFSGRCTLRRQLYFEGSDAAELTNFEARCSVPPGGGALVFDEPLSAGTRVPVESFLVEKKQAADEGVTPSRVLQLGGWVLTGNVQCGTETMWTDMLLSGPGPKLYGSQQPPLPEPVAMHFSRLARPSSPGSPPPRPSSPSPRDAVWMDAFSR